MLGLELPAAYGDVRDLLCEVSGVRNHGTVLAAPRIEKLKGMPVRACRDEVTMVAVEFGTDRRFRLSRENDLLMLRPV